LPNATMVSILLIKLGLTFKKVCLSLSGYYKSLRLLAFSTVPNFSKHKVLLAINFSPLITGGSVCISHTVLYSIKSTIISKITL